MNKKKEKKRFKAKSFNRASVKIPSNTSESGQKITVFYKLKSQLSNLQLKTPVLRWLYLAHMWDTWTDLQPGLIAAWKHVESIE